MTMSLDVAVQKINEWGEVKGILPNPDPFAQFFKTQEEVDELYAAIHKGSREEVKDAIGDIFVTLCMQCPAWNLTMAECVEHAYNIISKRTGKMVNGQFVKDK